MNGQIGDCSCADGRYADATDAAFVANAEAKRIAMAAFEIEMNEWMREMHTEELAADNARAEAERKIWADYEYDDIAA